MLIISISKSIGIHVSILYPNIIEHKKLTRVRSKLVGGKMFASTNSDMRENRRHVNSEYIVILAQCSFTTLMQRISNPGGIDIPNTIHTPDKVVKVFIQ